MPAGQGPSPRPAETKEAPRPAGQPEAETAWSLSLREAIRIGINNCEIIRVIEAPGEKSGTTTLVIAARGRDVDPYRFRAEVMALASLDRTAILEAQPGGRGTVIVANGRGSVGPGHEARGGEAEAR